MDIGRTRIAHLLFLANGAPRLRKACSSSALHLIQTTTKDVSLYNRALFIRNTMEDNMTVLPQDYQHQPDRDWCDTTERNNRAELEKLDLELRTYQNNLIKDSIRVCMVIQSNLLTNYYFRWAIEILEIISVPRAICQRRKRTTYGPATIVRPVNMLSRCA